jgi:hypothetical protein
VTVFIEAMHTVRPLTNTAFDRYVEFYGNDVMPVLARHGFDVVGAWKRTGGVMGEDVLLIRFENMAAYEQAGASMATDPALAKAMASYAGDFSIRERAKSARPVPYATEQRLERALAARPEKPRQYMQAVLQMELGGEPAAYKAIGELADLLETHTKMSLATAYETAIGQRGELTDIWVMGDGLPSMAYTPGDPLAELMAGLRKAAPEEATYFLNPLPYSPLQ